MLKKISSSSIYVNPPTWLVLVLVLIVGAFAQAFANIMSMAENMVLLGGIGLVWGAYQLTQRCKKYTYVPWVFGAGVFVIAAYFIWTKGVNEERQKVHLAGNPEFERAMDRAAGVESPVDCEAAMKKYPTTTPFIKGCEHLQQQGAMR